MTRVVYNISGRAMRAGNANGMSTTAISAALDAHDALVRDCAEGRLIVGEFLGAYGDFPCGYGWEEDPVSPEEREALRLFRRRVAFHRQVAGMMSGLLGTADMGAPEEGGAREFLPVVGLMRLRELVARHPNLDVTGGIIGAGLRSKPY
jgi:hypothetical protein